MTDDVIDALVRSRAWLATAGMRTDASARHVLQALLGVWVCDRAIDEESPERRALAARAAELLDAEDFDPYEYDPKLLFVCLQVSWRDGGGPTALARFAKELAASLAPLPLIPSRHAGVAAILHELGLLRTRPLDVDEADVDELLRGGVEAVRAACSSVAAATHFGARQSPVRFSGLRRTLPVLFLQSLRAYDLDTAAMLLRASRYLRMPRADRIEEGIAFLVDQQKPDGRFGYFAVESSALVESQEVAAFDELLTLSLPVTSTCAWALAELVSGGPALFERRPVKEEPWSMVS
jgi:hypothetical protein